MFKSLSIKEEKQLSATTKISIVRPHSKVLGMQNDDRHKIYFYPKDCFSEGIVVFTCFHLITNDSFIFYSIEIYESSDDLYGLDEEVIYSLIPLFIKFSIESAILARKNIVILKSGMQHFADHLVENKFRIYKRIERSSSGCFNIVIKGVKNIELENSTHEIITY